MTGYFLLDWAIMAVSLVNVILQLWLGMTVLLNAERRTWGVWLAGGGLLLGATFFISHTAILGFGLDYISSGLNLWWRIGWLPVVGLPFVWYLVMLWYAGFWQDQSPYLPIQQRGWILCTFLLLLGLVGWLLIATPLPSFTQVIAFELSTVPTLGGAPAFLLIYPLYIVLCISLALNTLRHPGPSERMMADLARHRARPWLIAATVMLLSVSLLVAGVIAWILFNIRQQNIFVGRYLGLSLAVAWFDFIIALLIAIAVLLVGQAVVSYEVFTGKALPRGELQRYWRNAIILAIGYGIVVGWSFSLQVQPIYSLVLTTILMVLFYALLSWRSYTWRERYIRNLRPFVASQHLYEHLLATLPATVNVGSPFHALCAEVLEARLAYLIALGPLAPLVSPLSYPENIPPLLTNFTEIIASFDSPQMICRPVNSDITGGALWAIPLWSERGLIGLFLLGPKWDGGLYTQEEIEIAQASGERLIDTRASAEIAQRLMALQRQRLAQSQILDQQTRRILHDDVLPDLHAALLTLNDEANNKTTITLLTDVHHQISDLLREMPKPTVPALNRFGLVAALKRVIAHELAGAFKNVVWQVEAEAEQLINQLAPLTTEVIFYAIREAIRNAAHHGPDEDSPNLLQLKITITLRAGLTIWIEDDGQCMEAAKVSGNGHGLALHSTMLAIIGGVLDIESIPNNYTRVTITLPQPTTVRNTN